MAKEIIAHVKAIVENIENEYEGETNCDGEQYSAFDLISEALDIEFIVNAKREFIGARILVAFGGPNIWINTRNNTVEGYWWNDEYTESYLDNMGIEEAVSQLWDNT